MKIEVGKKYITRSGRVVTIKRQINEPDYPWIGSYVDPTNTNLKIEGTWTEDGSYYYGTPEKDPMDLVKPYVESGSEIVPEEFTQDNIERAMPTYDPELIVRLPPNVTPLQQSLHEALQSDDQHQRLIAQEGLLWIDLILTKNRDYGSSAFKVPVLAPQLSPTVAIEVRISDKIERLNNLAKNALKPGVDESVDDTYDDLGAYCLLRRISKLINNGSLDTTDKN